MSWRTASSILGLYPVEMTKNTKVPSILTRMLIEVLALISVDSSIIFIPIGQSIGSCRRRNSNANHMLSISACHRKYPTFNACCMSMSIMRRWISSFNALTTPMPLSSALWKIVLHFHRPLLWNWPMPRVHWDSTLLTFAAWIVMHSLLMIRRQEFFIFSIRQPILTLFGSWHTRSITSPTNKNWSLSRITQSVRWTSMKKISFLEAFSLIWTRCSYGTSILCVWLIFYSRDEIISTLSLPSVRLGKEE